MGGLLRTAVIAMAVAAVMASSFREDLGLDLPEEERRNIQSLTREGAAKRPEKNRYLESPVSPPSGSPPIGSKGGR